MTANCTARFGPAWENPPEIIDDYTLSGTPETPGLLPLLEPLETSQSDQGFLTYRQRFMRGHEKEYAATEAVYKEMYGSPSNHHLMGIRDCRKYAKFSRNADSGEVKVMSSSCRDRWCPMCAAEKAHFAKEQTSMYVNALKAPRFLTLTLRNDVSDLKSQITSLQESFRKLRCRAYWKKKVTGGIWFLQVKRGHNSGCWHPHLHILLDGMYLEQGRLSALWELITYGSLVVDIRRIHNPDSTAAYVSRYVARPARLSEMSEPDRREVIEALHGKRLCGTFGTAKCVTLTPPKVESDGEWHDVGYYDEIAKKVDSCPDCKAVVAAYNNQTPLPDEVFYRFSPLPDVVQTNAEIQRGPIQMYLDFYNTR